MTREREIEILMMDHCTRAEAEKHLDDFEEFFEKYMSEWGIEGEEKEEYKTMIEDKKPVMDWGIVEDGGKTYYISYAL